MSTGGKNTKTIDFWRWRQRDANDGTARKTLFGLTPRDGSGAFAEIRRLPARKPPEEKMRPDFEDTAPVIGRLEPD